MEIAGTVALVTGGASGLGLATVHTLLAKGASVVIIDLDRPENEELARSLGDRVRFVPADVRDPEAVQRAIDATTELGALRIVVNCAGTGEAVRTVGRGNVPYPLENFQRIVEINLFGTFNVIRLAAAHMAALELVGEERGVIVNTASVAAYDGQIGQASYAASKAAIVGMTLPIARDLSTMAIRVMTVAPGLFDTPLFATMTDEARQALGDQVPHPRRLGTAPEFAALVSHIVENPMLNGETIRLDGAVRMAPR